MLHCSTPTFSNCTRLYISRSICKCLFNCNYHTTRWRIMGFEWSRSSPHFLWGDITEPNKQTNKHPGKIWTQSWSKDGFKWGDFMWYGSGALLLRANNNNKEKKKTPQRDSSTQDIKAKGAQRIVSSSWCRSCTRAWAFYNFINTSRTKVGQRMIQSGFYRILCSFSGGCINGDLFELY